MFFDRKFDTPGWLLKLYDSIDWVKYALLRPIIAEISWYSYSQFRFRRIFRSAGNLPLKKGISVYIPMKDEDTFLITCLERLLDIADQFILIDNGSTDNTLKVLYEFREKYQNRKEIIVLPLPEKLLVEIVQIALSYVHYEWVLKWDGDMIAITEGKENLLSLRKRILDKKRPVAYALPRFNLWGDFFHVSNVFPVIDQGEPFLRTFNNAFVFSEEFGRLEHAVIPKYYQLKTVDYLCSVHLSKIRPLLRLIYREMYLDWRQTINNSDDEDRNRYSDFEKFKRDWKLNNFGTLDELALKYRIGRLFASMAKVNDYPDFTLPTIMSELVKNGKHKFEIIYRDSKPYRMHEIDDQRLANYIPSGEDETWKPSAENYYSDKRRLSFTNLYK